LTGIKVVIYQAHLESFDRAFGIFLKEWADKPLNLPNTGVVRYPVEDKKDNV